MRTEISNDLSRAAELLKAGEVVAVPTETVYGLAANALDENAIAKIFAAKGRPRDNPLIVHVSSVEHARAFAGGLPPDAETLYAAFAPGPITLILPAPPELPRSVTAGLDTMGLRVPEHPVTRRLIEMCGFPLAAPSANVSGKPSPTTARHVLDDLDGKIPFILDGGACRSGVESTVFDVSSAAVLRPGGITREQIENALGKRVTAYGTARPDAPRSPGMKYRHYAPEQTLTLLGADGVFILPKERVIIYEGERDIYSALREADKRGEPITAVLPRDASDALIDRITRAAGGFT